MIEQKTYKYFAENLHKNIKGLYPLSAQIELTHRCNMDCVYCYCKGLPAEKELTTSEWKGIIDQLRSAGTLWLTITGGEPLMRDDCFEIYEYARKKGFLITLFTNGFLLGRRAIKYLAKHPPYSLEITLNGISPKTYESITGVRGSFKKVMSSIKKTAAYKIPLVLKTIGLKENKSEISQIKAFSKKLLGKKKFKFDSFVIPRLDGNKTPCLHRLSPAEIFEIEEKDPDMRTQREEEFQKHKPLPREREYKYHCNAWFNQFYINPYGRLQFCHITDEYSSDLKKTSFIESFYGKFPAILLEKYKSNSKCVTCDLKEYCYHCPARARLETGTDELPVNYYCELARAKKARMEKIKEFG